MPYGKKKGRITLDYEAHKRRLRAGLHMEWSIVLADAMDEALYELAEQFWRPVMEGKGVDFEWSREERRAFLCRAAVREFGAESLRRAIQEFEESEAERLHPFDASRAGEEARS